MSHSFKTLNEALDAGYRTVSHATDKDVSGTPYFGYDFQNEAGETTVDVWLSEEKNKLGKKGCVRPMYPPK